MEHKDWQRVAAIFAAALDQPTSARHAFVAERCGDDADLLGAVISLLSADARTHSLLDGVAADAVAATDLTLLANQRLGPYRVVRQIGTGGMATVYLAERADGAFSQTVALKLMRPGRQSDELARRFRAERQLLAQLEHPAIARLIDGGVTGDGRPYFTMEYVDGVPIDTYCDRNQLSIDQRLALFTQVLGAVAYAQQNLVVHRDLKPSNILVTSDGAVKLLDFGIAKVLADDAVAAGATCTAMGAMTPQYAAPEQVRGAPVTTATDVYALGIVLYELLCGERPYVLASFAPSALDEVICRTVPPPPSAALPGDDTVAQRIGTPAGRVRRRLAGDLDTICAMALRKEPARRYASAAQMLDDLERHRAGRPVRARPDTLGYLLQKFIHRHKRLLAVAVVAGLAIAGLLVFYTARLAHERDRAQREAHKAAAVSEFLVDLFQDADPWQRRGEELTIREILDRGAARIEDELAGQPLVRTSILDVIATIYERLGLFREAGELWRESLRAREALYTRHPDLATSLHSLGRVRSEQGKYDEAEALLRRALAMRESLLGGHAVEVAQTLDELGFVVYSTGSVDEAEALYRRAIDIAKRGDQVDALSPMNNLAILLHARHDYEGAARLYREVVALERARFGDDHPKLMSSLHNLSQVLMDQGALDEAEQLEREALALTRELHGAGVSPAEATQLAGLGRVLELQYDYEQAEIAFRQALAIHERVRGERHPFVAYVLNDIARLHRARGRYDDAEKLLRRSTDILTEHFGARSRDVAFNVYLLGLVRYAAGDYEGAVALHRRALAAQRAHWGGEHPRVTKSFRALAGALAATGALDEALAMQERAVANARDKWGEDHHRYLTQLGALAEIRRARGQYDRAEASARRALDGLRRALGGDHPEAAAAMAGLARILRDQQRHAEAEALFESAVAIWRRPAFAGHPRLAYALIGQGEARLALGEAGAAEPLLREGVAILAQAVPATHPRLIAARQALARCQ